MLFADEFHDLISSFGGLFVGLAAIITALWGLRGVKRRANDECDKRIEEIKDAFRRGTEYELRKEKT